MRDVAGSGVDGSMALPQVLSHVAVSQRERTVAPDPPPNDKQRQPDLPPVKRCGRCHQVKPIESFPFRRERKHQRNTVNSWCRACHAVAKQARRTELERSQAERDEPSRLRLPLKEERSPGELTRTEKFLIAQRRALRVFPGGGGFHPMFFDDVAFDKAMTEGPAEEDRDRRERALQAFYAGWRT